jgi:hypothetical protein
LNEAGSYAEAAGLEPEFDITTVTDAVTETDERTATANKKERVATKLGKRTVGENTHGSAEFNFVFRLLCQSQQQHQHWSGAFGTHGWGLWTSLRH